MFKNFFNSEILTTFYISFFIILYLASLKKKKRTKNVDSNKVKIRNQYIKQTFELIETVLYQNIKETLLSPGNILKFRKLKIAKFKSLIIRALHSISQKKKKKNYQYTYICRFMTQDHKLPCKNKRETRAINSLLPT